ncbi:hypothetical protein O181_105978 [Austropuccinia psidii MF-1]|uniref:Uncharacterized protein n=1 Tax=Austropuccinia psidii MF-1 TaxID=1389203 RepID=A0A9Q3JPZ8_9BASI|nr:hypothetical protein [Austropuccinia psidii MF-1]
MHLPDHLDWWGPPMGVSEFAGERLVGILQNIKNNHLNSAMEETLMKKFSQKQRLKVQTPDKTTKQGGKSKKIYELRNKTYGRLLEYLRSTHPHLRDFGDLPHPQNALVLPNYETDLQSAEWRGIMKISSTQPNNIIYFKDVNSRSYGEVSPIIDLDCNNLHIGPIIIVKVLKNSEERIKQFKQVEVFMKALDIAQVEHSGFLSFIPMEKVVSLAAYRKLPAWTLGIHKPSFLVRSINKLVGLESQTLQIDGLHDFEMGT